MNKYKTKTQGEVHVLMRGLNENWVGEVREDDCDIAELRSRGWLGFS